MTDEKCPYEVGKLYPTRGGGKREFIGLNRHNKKYPFIFCNIEDGCVYTHGADGRYLYDVDEHPFDIISTTPIREARKVKVWAVIYDNDSGTKVVTFTNLSDAEAVVTSFQKNWGYTNLSKLFQIETVEPMEGE